MIRPSLEKERAVERLIEELRHTNPYIAIEALEETLETFREARRAYDRELG